VVKAFNKVLIDRKQCPSAGEKVDAPDDYALHIRLAGGSTAGQVEFRFREAQDGKAYRLRVDFGTREVVLSDDYRAYSRTCEFRPGQALDLKAFVVGTVVECFLNDAFCFTMRAYDRQSGKFSFSATGGTVELDEFALSTRGKGRQTSR
jgi:hypothetical protein